jgi:hypothetical protein
MIVVEAGFMKKFKETRLRNFRGFHGKDLSDYEFSL